MMKRTKRTAKRAKRTPVSAAEARRDLIGDLLAAVAVVNVGYPYFNVPRTLRRALKYVRSH
jgi:predicted urease superfamily metal-dependent hydrolase